MKLFLPSAGGLTGCFILQHLHEKHPQYYLVAQDTAAYSTAQKLADRFYRTPPVNDPCYVDVVLDIIQKEKIDVVLPISSYDMSVYTKENVKERLRAMHIGMLTMNEDDYEHFFDKLRCAETLDAWGLDTPARMQKDAPRFPCMLKSRRSTGSRKVLRLAGPEDLAYWYAKIEDAFLCEYVEGKEYTVDCLFRADGSCVGWNVRERLKTVGGGAVLCRNADEEEVGIIIKKMEMAKCFKGPLNFQYRVDQAGRRVVFDVNTRLASGGLALSVHAGFDIPALLVRLSCGEDVPNWTRGKENKDLIMLRYYKEMFI